MTRTDVRGLLALVDAAWPEKTKLPDEEEDMNFLVGAWHRLLKDLDSDAAYAAVDSLISQNHDFPPTLGQIRSEALHLLGLSDTPEVDQAWSEVLGQLSAVGSYGTPTFSDPAIATAVEAMGWRNLCMSENAIADRAHFLKIYGTVKSRAEREALMPASVRELMRGAAAAIGHPGELEP